ncbi:unnamed protein product, partial [Mesorhabditis belari]|uniref:Uncharacterized protein n=1 Tax=Mesorhabditis belari TaxID=2138241 RepID=A0AAF3J238_9BILA
MRAFSILFIALFLIGFTLATEPTMMKEDDVHNSFAQCPGTCPTYPPDCTACCIGLGEPSGVCHESSCVCA